MLPTAALLALNGLYLGAAFRASVPLFWFLDLAHFVLVPIASVWALWRFAGVRPPDYGLGPLAGRQPGAAALAVYALVVAAFAYGYGFARILALFVPWEWPATGFLYSQAFPQHAAGGLALLAYLSLTEALAEEIVFRGLPALWLRAHVYPLASAAAFAAIHWESGTREVVATFLLGVVLAALYLRVRNLWPFVTGHAVTDILAFTGTYTY
ncbi:MAG TPA: CPBP family intramembrane glutamic endopeptidase [Burkholderiales bacterium]